MQLGIACICQQLQRGLVNSLWPSSCLFLLAGLSLSIIQYCGLLYLHVELIWSSRYIVFLSLQIRPLISKTTSCLKDLYYNIWAIFFYYIVILHYGFLPRPPILLFEFSILYCPLPQASDWTFSIDISQTTSLCMSCL